MVVRPPFIYSALIELTTYKLIQLMKNQDFQLKLLIKQNTQMVTKLQLYRRQNQDLTIKNQNLNSWVQNLSQVFASMAAAWKIITDNEQALFTLMRKKSDTNSKQMVGKYISHFKAFDQIIANLGEKITNEGHSDTAALDAKTRLTSFVSNYNLFFMELVQTYFKFNEQCMAMANERLKQDNLPAQLRQIMAQSTQSRQKIKQFEQYITKSSLNFKLYEKHNQHELLDGVLSIKNRQIEQLKNCTYKQARRIEYMTDYNAENVSYILENDSNFECFCGGAQLKYFSQLAEEKLKREQSVQRVASSRMLDQSEEVAKQRMKQLSELQVQREILMQRNTQLQAKCQRLKLQGKLSDEMVLQSPLYLHLRGQFKDLMDYTNDLILKINKNYDYLGEIERVRLEEIEELRRRGDRPGQLRQLNGEQSGAGLGLGESVALGKFKERVEGYYLQLKGVFVSISGRMREKEEHLQQTKDALKSLKKENEELNRRVGQYQERQLKGVEVLQFRHQKFGQLQKRVGELLREPNAGVLREQLQHTRKVWQQFTEYVKTRDKKIKAMEQMLKKKDKQLVQKQKVQQVMKNAMAETEDIYLKYKEKLDRFDEFMSKSEKEITNLSEENYRIKIELEQEKNILSIRLKNELEVRARMEERLKALEKVEEEARTSRLMEAELQRMLQAYMTVEKERVGAVQLQVKERQREIQQLGEVLAEKERCLEKLIEEKERKNLQISKLHLQLKAKTEFESLRNEMEEYKSKIMCRCGADREREVVLKTCPHIFCRKCIDDTTANRNRKCPICGVKFTKTDIHDIVWT